MAASDLTGQPPAAVMLDTNVYINAASGNLPEAAARVLADARVLNCTVCVAELTVGLGAADSQHPGWKRTRAYYEDLIAAMPARRLVNPDASVWAEAGLIAGILGRTQGHQAHLRKELLNDALIYLTAAKAGLPVLTADWRDFDLIQQVSGRGAFIHY